MEKYTQMPIISVIVPIYNVEPYIQKCISSILTQTYQRLEIILVDDGSPDNCGLLIDEYAALDERVRVIHKANGGLSSARNAGIRIATGDYLGFVDGDDWIDPDMFEYLLRNAREYSADIAVCGRIEEYKNRSVRYFWKELRVLNREHAIQALLEDQVMQSYAWNKLWKKSLFDDIWFPEGRNYEDIAVIHRAYVKTERVICLPEAKYHYLQRKESIVRDISLRNRMGYWLSTKQRYDELEQDWPQFIPILEAQCAMAAANVWSICFVNKKSEQKKAMPYLAEMSVFVKERIPSIYKSVNFGLTGRITLRLVPHVAWWSFMLAHLLDFISRLKHGNPF